MNIGAQHTLAADRGHAMDNLSCTAALADTMAEPAELAELGAGPDLQSESALDRINLAWLLPPGVEVIPKLLALMKDPDAPTEELVDVVRLDAGLTADVLKVCNSAAYASSCPVDTVAMAVNRIGLRELYRISLEAVTSASFRQLDEIGPPILDLWEHSLTVAVAAQIIARETRVDPELAFTGGLLHDIGKLALWKEFGEEYRSVSDEASAAGQSLSELEAERFGLNHAAVGGRVLSQWNFPEEIARGVAFHHLSEEDPAHGELAALVCLANHLARGLYSENAETTFPPRALEALELREESLLQYVDDIRSRVAREKELISI